jgi:hypothetical protein
MVDYVKRLHPTDETTFTGYAPTEFWDVGFAAMWKPGFGSSIAFEIIPGGAAENVGMPMGTGVSTSTGSSTVRLGVQGGRQPGQLARLVVDDFGRNYRALTLQPLPYPQQFRTDLDPDGNGYVRLYTIPEPGPVLDLVESELRRLAPYVTGGWILDIRGTTGGSPEGMANIAALFGYRGVITEVQRRGSVNSLEAPNRPTIRSGKSLVVVTNYNTLGSAEVLASALKESGSAYMVGDFTFGTGTLTRRYKLGPALLTITIGKTSIPLLGRAGDWRGVMPSYWVNIERSFMRDSVDSQLEGARRALREFPPSPNR